MAQCWMSGEKSTQEGREGAAQELENHVLGCWEPRSWDRWSKNEKNSDALDTGGAHDVRMGNIPSLEWFQVIPNGKSRLADPTKPVPTTASPTINRTNDIGLSFRY